MIANRITEVHFSVAYAHLDAVLYSFKAYVFDARSVVQSKK